MTIHVVVREHCDRCGESSPTIDLRAGACLCARCVYDLQRMPLTMFHVELGQWKYRPENAQRVREATYAA